MHIGSIEVGEYADLAVFDVEDYREIPYYCGVTCCAMAVKRAEIVYSRERT
jgi:imidazolonepropionase-like amidohydrolase